MITTKYRIYPNKNQTEKLEFALDIYRQAYNIMLGELREQAIIDRNMIQAVLPDLKICEPRFREVYSKALQYECYKLFSNLSALSALKKQGRKVGRLKFKGKKLFDTMTYNQSGFDLEHIFGKNGRLKLSKIGDVKVKLHRLPEGNVKQVTIKRINDKWFAFVIADGKTRLEHGDKTLGIDLGINHYVKELDRKLHHSGCSSSLSTRKLPQKQFSVPRNPLKDFSCIQKTSASSNCGFQAAVAHRFFDLVDSEGNKVEHPRNYEKTLPQLKIAHRKLSRKKKGSHNRLKAKKGLNKMYGKMNNQRNDFLHKTSTDLIRRSKIIVVEDLNVKGMMEQKYFNAKNVADSSWNKFIQMLEYKSENSGVQLIKVNPKNTTKTCSNCSHVQKMPLWVRTYKCENCLFEMCRDENSAINIKNLGLGQPYVEIISDSSSEEQLSMKQEAITSAQC